MEDKFTDINEIKTKIINLSATLNLPKGTEAFISDVHGNDDKYLNIIRSGAGNISRKVGELFNGRLTIPNQQKLVCLIYYPEDILKKITPDLEGNDLEQWYMDTTNQMIEVLR
ncbi:fructose-bisphosphatase class III, partial [Companilactobacillus farciminis]